LRLWPYVVWTVERPSSWFLAIRFVEMDGLSTFGHSVNRPLICGAALPLFIRTHKHLCQVFKALLKWDNFVFPSQKVLNCWLREWLSSILFEAPRMNFYTWLLEVWVLFLLILWMVMEAQYTISLQDGIVGRLLPNFNLLLPFQLSHAFDWSSICIGEMYAASTILGLCFCWPISMTPEGGCIIRWSQSTTWSGNHMMRWYLIIFMFNWFIELEPISFLGL
jgi:hypothetical protein